MSMYMQGVFYHHSNIVNIEENDDGTYTYYDADWNVVTLTDSEVTTATAKGNEILADRQLEKLRKARNNRLAETDYWGNPDTPDMTQAQLDYRQALRDITNTYTSLETVVWPTKP